MPKLTNIFFTFLVALSLMSFWSCSSPEKPVIANVKPITRLANIPPPDTFVVTSSPRLTLTWVGDDPDGFVVAFRYRWSFRVPGTDSIAYKPWATILNVWNADGGGIPVPPNEFGPDIFALLTDADVAKLPQVYHYFAILFNGLSKDDERPLSLGESIRVAGANVWASNGRRVQYPVHTKPTSGTFIFDSQEKLNAHTFEIVAVDNNGLIGNSANVSFGNPGSPSPHSEVIGFPTDTVLVLNDITESWGGIRFEFRGFDANSRTIEYSWVVDRDEWPSNNIPWSPFTQNPAAYVTGKNLPDPFASGHRIYVRARNEFGVIDTAGVFLRQKYDNNNTPLYDSAGVTLTHSCSVCTPIVDTIYAWKDFVTVYPPFLKPGYTQRILLLNIGYSSSEATVAHPTREMVDDYYLSLFDSIGKNSNVDVVNVPQEINGRILFPGIGKLSNYSTIVFVGDGIQATGNPPNFSFWSKPVTNWGVLRDELLSYAYVGGKMIVSTWNLPYIFNIGPADPFIKYICHIQNVEGRDPYIIGPTFLSAIGDKGYPDIAVDTTKLDPLWHGSLFYLHPGRPYGFGEIISRYHTARHNIFPDSLLYENKTIGVRYNGPTYSTVYFGFPLYYMEQHSVIGALRKAFSDINELDR